MSARFSENTESGSNVSSVEPVIEAGVNRSGKVRLIPLDSGSEAPPAASSTSNLLGNQAVGTSPTPESLTNLLPAPAGMSASSEGAGSQVAGGSNSLQQPEVVQSDQERESVTSEPDIEKSDSDTPSKMGDKDKEEVQIVEESPTHFDVNHLPRTIEAGRFTGIVTRAQTLRTQILKGLKNMDKCIAQLVQLENEEEDVSDWEEYIESL